MTSDTLYGISSVLTVPQAVPEPSTLTMLGTALASASPSAGPATAVIHSGQVGLLPRPAVLRASRSPCAFFGTRL